LKILAINCGSSSIKYKLYETEGDSELCSGIIEKLGSSQAAASQRVGGQIREEELAVANHEAGIGLLLGQIEGARSHSFSGLDDLAGIGHRVVHGGEHFRDAVLVTEEVTARIESLVPLAPLHNRANLDGIRAVRKLLPGKPNCAVFDTAFHQTLAPEAFLYALPHDLYRKHGIRRYGFHGSSHRYVSTEAARLAGKPLGELKIITCHLGNGSSIAAVQEGRVVDTSMGMTPLEGLIMGTRCGDLDPALPGLLLEKEGLTPGALDELLNKKSGLKGICGYSDLRDIESRAAAGDDRCLLAFRMFCRRIKKYIGSYAALMGGLDVLAFTGGIGENSEFTRGTVTEGLVFLGIELDAEKNQAPERSARAIHAYRSSVQVHVIPTDEERIIARETHRVLASQGLAEKENPE
jgi:acetate kinase